MRTLLVLAMLCLSPGVAAFAQTTQEPPPSTSDATAAPAARVPVPEPSEKALAYHRSGNVLWVINTIWGLAIPALFLMTGLSARIRTWARTLGRKWFFVIGLYFIIFSVINFVIDLPLSYYQGFVRQHAYGLSNQTFQKWATDQLTGLMVSLVIGVLFLWVPYLLLKKSPRRWWLYTGLAAVPFLILIIFVQPIWIDPLFNHFGPMKDKALEAQILRLAERSGIEGSRVFEVAKSEDTKAINAYVNGVGGTKRIVLWDTILARLEPPQLLVVMGHEMAHFVLGHVWKSIAIFSMLIMATLYAVHRVAGRLVDRYRDRLGFSELSDVASLPLIILLFGGFSFLVTPVALVVQRHFEHEADRFALEITHGNHAAATAFVTLQQDNLAVPRPSLLYVWWRESHPPLGDRIDFCNDYRPWETGAPEVYAHLFKQR
jgi:Zn-dependent protease with chaperone function